MTAALPEDASAPAGRRLAILPLGIALLGLLLNIVVATSMSETFDEPDYVLYGLAILHGKPDRFKTSLDSKMPVSVLNALPAAAADYLHNHHKAPRLERVLRDMRARRYGTIVVAFCLCLLVFLYTDRLFGRTAALFAETLFVMSRTSLPTARWPLTISMSHSAFCSPYISFAGISCLAVPATQLWPLSRSPWLS